MHVHCQLRVYPQQKSQNYLTLLWWVGQAQVMTERYEVGKNSPRYRKHKGLAIYNPAVEGWSNSK